MSEKIKKFDKEFCFTDDSVNVYGFRCLTDGLQLSEVEKNPIGFHMHNRDKGVVVRWEDFRVDGSKVWAKPVVNLAHPDGQNIADQIENGFLNGASAGKIVCLAASDDPKLKLPGQTGATITKWFPREISLVDIPGNFNAVACLVDALGNEINLADLVNSKPEDMSKILLAATVLAALNLKDDSDQEAFNAAVLDLADKASKVPQLTQDLADMTEKHNALQTENEALKKGDVPAKVADLIAKGIEGKKLTVEMGEKLKTSYAENPEGLKDLIDAIPAQTVITEDLKDKTPLAEFEGKKWDDLYATGKLETVRVQYPDLYATLRKEKYPNLKD